MTPSTPCIRQPRRLPMIYPNSIVSLENDLSQAPDTALTSLAARIIEGAKALDLHKAETLGVNFRFSGVVRDRQNPPDFTHNSVIGAPWADDEANPLQEGEKW